MKQRGVIPTNDGELNLSERAQESDMPTNKYFFGTNGDDRGGDALHGTDSANFVDHIHGLDGSDELFGYAGTDFIYGGGGDDRLAGGTGVDLMQGGSGFDTL